NSPPRWHRSAREPSRCFRSIRLSPPSSFPRAASASGHWRSDSPPPSAGDDETATAYPPLTVALRTHYDPAMPPSPDVAAWLAPVAGRSTARITTRGRKSGKPHTVTIWFLIDGATIYLGTLAADRDWVRNAAKTPDVALEIDGVRVRGKASVVTDAAVEAH